MSQTNNIFLEFNHQSNNNTYVNALVCSFIFLFFDIATLCTSIYCNTCINNHVLCFFVINKFIFLSYFPSIFSLPVPTP